MSERKKDLLLLSFWVLLVFWVRAWNGDLRADALSYAVIAKGMAEGGHWLDPRIIDIPYQNKPPLFFWLVAGFFKLLGVGFYAAKLPALIFATADVFLIYLVALKWFKERDIAFFSAFSFATTRWLVRDFTTVRPESLLVFALLMGLYSFSLISEKKKSGPYLLGLSFILAYMAKMSFAFLLPLWFFIYALGSGRVREWLWWPHLYGGALFGFSVPALWLLMFEARSPGYMRNIFIRETFEKAAQGFDVGTDKLMYLKEFLLYQPWLIFLLVGVVVLWRERKNPHPRFILTGGFLMGFVLQLSTGKAARYLIPLTPMLAMTAAHGIVRFKKINSFMRKFALYAAPVFLVFLWTVPVPINPPKFHTLHLAAELGKESPDYRETFAFLAKDAARTKIPLVQWAPGPLAGGVNEYRLSNYFYLPRGTPVWDDASLKRGAGKGNFLLLAPAPYIDKMPPELKPVLIHRDRYHALLLLRGRD